MNSTNRQIQVGDKLQVKIKGKFYDDIIEVSLINEKYNSENWIEHKPHSFSGGAFRLQSISKEGYLLDRDFIFYEEKQEFLKDINYNYLIPMLI